MATGREWMPHATCRGEDPKLFDGHSERRQVPPAAQAFCRRCPVATECLDYALEHDNGEAQQGIWGCTTPRQRKLIQRGLSRKRCPICLSVLIRREAELETCLSCAMSWAVPLSAVVAA